MQWGLSDHEPTDRFFDLFPEEFSLSENGGITKWRKYFHFVEVMFSGFHPEATPLELEKQKGSYLKYLARVRTENFPFLPHFPRFVSRTFEETESFHYYSFFHDFPLKTPILEWKKEAFIQWIDFFALEGAKKIVLVGNPPGHFFHTGHLPRIKQVLGWLKKEMASRGLTLVLESTGWGWEVLQTITLENRDLELSLNLATLLDEGLDLWRVFSDLRPSVKYLVLSQTQKGGLSHLPLFKTGYYNYRTILERLKTENFTGDLILRTPPSIKDFNLLGEILLSEQFDPQLRQFSPK